LREYLSMLAEKGLIEYEEGLQKYRTTDKGIRLLQIYNQMNDELIVANNVK
jgi:predicted transcriptional regulator